MTVMDEFEEADVPLVCNLVTGLDSRGRACGVRPDGAQLTCELGGRPCGLPARNKVREVLRNSAGLPLVRLPGTVLDLSRQAMITLPENR